MAHDLNDTAFWSQPISIDCTMVQVMAIHGFLCLALRHPEIGDSARAVIVDIVRHIGEQLIARQALTIEEANEAERGIKRSAAWDMYPRGWPACACGEPVLDGHLTCGASACNEAAARRTQ